MSRLENTTAENAAAARLSQTDSAPQKGLSRNVSQARFSKGATSLRPVSQIMRPLIKQAIPQKSVIFQQVFDLWADAVHGTEAVGTIPEKLSFKGHNQQQDGCLAIWAQSSAQATELSYNKAMLIHRINSLFGYNLLADIKVTAHPGKLPPRLEKQRARAKTNPAKVNMNRGVPSQSLDKILSGISNPSLKTILGELGGVLDPEVIVNKDSKGDNHA